MGKLKVKLNYAGVRELLRSTEMKAVIAERASAIKSKAGEGYKVYTAPTRVVAIVGAATAAAEKDNLENNTILKAMR